MKETGMDKVNNSSSMEADMKGSSKTANSMDKVTLRFRTLRPYIWFLILYSFCHCPLGKLFRADGTRHEGEFKNGKANGLGKVFDSAGKIIEKGMYKGGKLQKKWKIIDDDNDYITKTILHTQTQNHLNYSSSFFIKFLSKSIYCYCLSLSYFSLFVSLLLTEYFR